MMENIEKRPKKRNLFVSLLALLILVLLTAGFFVGRKLYNNKVREDYLSKVNHCYGSLHSVFFELNELDVAIEDYFSNDYLGDKNDILICEIIDEVRYEARDFYRLKDGETKTVTLTVDLLEGPYYSKDNIDYWYNCIEVIPENIYDCELDELNIAIKEWYKAFLAYYDATLDFNCNYDTYHNNVESTREEYLKRLDSFYFARGQLGAVYSVKYKK